MIDSLLPRAWSLALDLLFPPSCGICGAGGGFLCDSCRGRLSPAEPPRCNYCWAITARQRCSDCRGSPLDGVRCAFVFEGGARTLVHALKYRSLHALARPMGELLAGYLEANPMPVDLLVPVPLHGRRRRSRGFNQSEQLARVLATRVSVELDARSLRRHRSTSQQMQTDDRAAREANVRGAFRCDERVTGRRVLLIDDVLTTGATLRECAATVRMAGAASVWALTFSRAD